MDSSRLSPGQTISAGTAMRGLGSALLTLFFFLPWLTACNVEVSGLDLAMQQNPQGDSSAMLLLGVPLVGIIGVLLALTSLNKPAGTFKGQAVFSLIIACYPLLCLGLLYVSLKGDQPEAMLSRVIIKFEIGYWGTAVAALAMIAGAILDLASSPGSTAMVPSYPQYQTPPPQRIPTPLPHSSPPPAVVAPISQPSQPISSSQRESPSAWLEGRNGPWSNQRVAFNGDELKIGRHHTNDIQLSEKAVSRQHAIIRCGRGRYFIQDQGSSIGTFVNGQQVDACELHPGDTVSIGEHEFQFFTYS